MKTKLIVIIYSAISVSWLCTNVGVQASSSFSQSSIMSRLLKMQIPLLKRHVSVDLVNHPMTVEDVVGLAGQRFSKIMTDLAGAGEIVKGLGVHVLNYIKENPLDTALIVGATVTMYVVSSYILRSMMKTRCPCCTRNKHCYCRHADCFQNY